MPLRTQYVTDVGIAPDTYPAAAGQRVAGIYKTARRGKIDQPLARRIWTVLNPIYQQALDGELPVTQPNYDNLVIGNALTIQSILQPIGRGGFGIGQKVINLFMKDLWGLRIIKMPTEALLHAPLDKIVLSKLKSVPATWPAWSRVVATGPEDQVINDYLAIQQSIRTFLEDCPIAFPSVIQIEQFIWHRI